MLVETTPCSGEKVGRRPKLRSFDGECSTLDEKKGTKNDTADQKEVAREPNSLEDGEYNALRKPVIAIVMVEKMQVPQLGLTDL
jgi:hypothetical protein